MKCVTPITIKNPNPASYPTKGMYIQVPCGKCIACRVNKSKEWSVRLLYEAEAHGDNALFVTLTYDNDHLPADAGLHKDDLQRFFKRLRKDLSTDARMESVKIKYFACGEYGDNTHRPHYHFILFGLSPVYSHFISDNWSLGFVKIGSVSIKSINYVTGYVMKKYGGDKAFEEYGNRQPPFQLQSKGLGLDVFQKYEASRAEKKGYLTVNGVKRSIPRYYVKKLDMSLPASDNTLFTLNEVQRVLDANAKFDNKGKKGKL